MRKLISISPLNLSTATGGAERKICLVAQSDGPIPLTGDSVTVVLHPVVPPKCNK
jgi:hypothetical protein